jgi:subfamily B ATP-binding cassette protein MsbA
VIEGGQITEIGSHEELMQNSGTYQRLYNMQFGGEDPASVGNEVAVTTNLEGIA